MLLTLGIRVNNQRQKIKTVGADLFRMIASLVEPCCAFGLSELFPGRRMKLACYGRERVTQGNRKNWMTHQF